MLHVTFRVETIIVIINIIYSLTTSLGLAISPPGHEQIHKSFPLFDYHGPPSQRFLAEYGLATDEASVA